MKLKCEGRQEEELTGFLTSRSDSLEETEDRDSKRHLATEKEVTPRQIEGIDFPRRNKVL